MEVDVAYEIDSQRVAFDQCKYKAVHIGYVPNSAQAKVLARLRGGWGRAEAQPCHLPCELHGMSPIPLTENNIDFSSE